MIGVDHSTIAKWEAKKERVTGMEVQVEILLCARCRLFGNCTSPSWRKLYAQTAKLFRATITLQEAEDALIAKAKVFTVKQPFLNTPSTDLLIES